MQKVAASLGGLSPFLSFLTQLSSAPLPTYENAASNFYQFVVSLASLQSKPPSNGGLRKPPSRNADKGNACYNASEPTKLMLSLK